MNIAQIIKNQTIEYQNKTAIIQDNYQITYKELLDTADNLSSELKTEGIKKCHRVAILCNDGIDYIIITLAVLSINAVIVPVSLSLSNDEINEILKQIDVNHFIFDNTKYSQQNVKQIFSKSICTHKFCIYTRKTQKRLPADYYAINPAFIRFSSGTTGVSKGVVLSHESISQRTDAANKVLKITPDDVIIWVLSMSFHFVVTIILFLKKAATIIVCSNEFHDSLYAGLKNNTGTLIYASPFHYQMMTKSDLFSPELLSHVRLAVSTAMRLSSAEASGFYKKFKLEISQAYGLIEVGLPFINNSKDSAMRDSVGKILPDYKIKIINADEDGIGEVYLKGKGMFDAYFAPWQSREKILSDGWFNTGDLGKIDQNGFLFLVGREKNVINFLGMKIFPYEVESVLNQHPVIKESLIYGVCHSLYGELPCADIVLKDKLKTNFDKNGIRKFCFQRLASYKVPKEIRSVAMLDKTASEKLKRWHK